MASGFIYIEDGSAIAPRWTVYDEILRLVIRELTLGTIQQKELAEFISQSVPKEDEIEMGFGFINRSGETVGRNFDLRELSDLSRNYFWLSLKSVYEKLPLDKSYSDIDPGIIEKLLLLHQLQLKGMQTVHISELNQVEEYSGNKKGPGWE